MFYNNLTRYREYLFLDFRSAAPHNRGTQSATAPPGSTTVADSQSTTTTQKAPQSLSARDAITILVNSGGNVELAAAKASQLFGYTVTRELMSAAIASEPQALNTLLTQLRVLGTMQAWEAFRVVQMAFVQAVSKLEPKDVAKTYTNMLDTMMSYTNVAPNAQAPNTQDSVRHLLSQLPGRVADAVEYLLEHQNDTPPTQPT